MVEPCARGSDLRHAGSETGPGRGTWTDLLLQHVATALGSDHGYARWMFTDRRFFPPVQRVVFTHRFLWRMGENSVVALNAGTSAETTMPVYIGLGYPY